MSLPARPSGFLQRSQDQEEFESVVPGVKGVVGNDEAGAVDGWAGERGGAVMIKVTTMQNVIPRWSNRGLFNFPNVEPTWSMD
jgi:hypothetical protein